MLPQFKFVWFVCVRHLLTEWKLAWVPISEPILSPLSRPGRLLNIKGWRSCYICLWAGSQGIHVPYFVRDPAQNTETPPAAAVQLAG